MDFKPAFKTVVLALAAGSFAVAALAQWQWIDKDGRKVFSDRSPPSDIQEKDILRRPGNKAAPAVVASSEQAAPPAAAASSPKAATPRLAGKDPQLEAKKKQAEEEEAAKKKADDEKIAKAKTENCDAAKRYLTTLQSGVRIADTNAKGEREVMDDAKRAEEKKRTQAIADSNCK
jgi:Domain of unknown function (DUF4124)